VCIGHKATAQRLRFLLYAVAAVVGPFVCLSVTLLDCVETTKHHQTFSPFTGGVLQHRAVSLLNIDVINVRKKIKKKR